MSRRSPLSPEAWGLDADGAGRLRVHGSTCLELAATYGTPLHVLNEPRLESTAARFREAFEAAYPGPVRVHYAMKCNGVPAVLAAVRRAGLRAEVVTPFELELARRVGYAGDDLVANGPCKTEAFLAACVEHEVGLVVVDALDELPALARAAARAGRDVEVLLRVNPDYVPRGMSAGSATGSRKGCAFGLDLEGGEVERAFRDLASLPRLRFRGFHWHVGTGIHDPRDYARALGCLDRLLPLCRAAGRTMDVLDVGGGFGAPTTRELTAPEMVLAPLLRRSPRLGRRTAPGPAAFAEAIVKALRRHGAGGPLPTLIVEPGRSIASPNQLLLLRVHRVKERRGAGTWIVTDGGLGTVTLPTYYEVHEILLANDVRRPPAAKATVVGPACFAGDVVARDRRLPAVTPGDLLAVMDSGAYFTALESSFGFPRVAIAAVRPDGHRLVRRRESFDDMLARDEVARPRDPEPATSPCPLTLPEVEPCDTPS